HLYEEGNGLTPVATTGIAVSKYGIHCIFPGGAERNNQGLAYELTLLSLCTCDRFQHTHRADRLSGLRCHPPGRCHIPRYACRPGCICANGDVPAGNRQMCTWRISCCAITCLILLRKMLLTTGSNSWSFASPFSREWTNFQSWFRKTTVPN